MSQEDRMNNEWRDVAIAFIILDFTFLLLRYIARRVIHEVPWGWDDTLIHLALLPNVAICALDLRNYELNVALDATSDDATATRIVQELRKIGWGTDLAYPLAFTLPKLAMLCMYLRVFTNDKRLRRAIYVVIAFCAADCVAFLMVDILECRPLDLLWDPRYLSHPLPAECVEPHHVNIAINIPNIASDLIILLLPMRAISKLQLPLAKRVGIALTFAVGCVGMFASALRLAFYVEMRKDMNQSLFGYLWDDMTVIEPSTYLIAACLPAFQAFFKDKRSKHTSLHATAREDSESDRSNSLRRILRPLQALVKATPYKIQAVERRYSSDIERGSDNELQQ